MSFEDWRRIDIDQYDPDNQYAADELPDMHNSTTTADMQALTQNTRALIQRMDIASALKLIIEQAPYGASSDVIESFLKCVYEVFVSVKSTDIAGITGNLDVDACDSIVKFLYVLMSREWALKQSGILLAWMDKIVEKAGDGPIVRYLSDPYKLWAMSYELRAMYPAPPPVRPSILWLQQQLMCVFFGLFLFVMYTN